jgi:hypothetical protein
MPSAFIVSLVPGFLSGHLPGNKGIPQLCHQIQRLFFALTVDVRRLGKIAESPLAGLCHALSNQLQHVIVPLSMYCRDFKDALNKSAFR